MFFIAEAAGAGAAAVPAGVAPGAGAAAFWNVNGQENIACLTRCGLP